MNDEKSYQIMVEDFAKFASTKSGRDIVYHLLSLCNLYSDCYTGDNDTYYMLGKKSIGLAIIEMLNEADPTVYPNMLLKHTREMTEDSTDTEETENDY